MESAAAVALREIGVRLDQGLYPVVRNGGLVVPSRPDVPILSLGQEKLDGYAKGSRGPAVGSWERATGRKGKADGPRAPGPAAPVFVPTVRSNYDSEVVEVKEAYPGAQFWHQGGGFWLATESRLLADAEQRAIFLTAVSYEQLIARSWGFWRGQSKDTPVWIGPRHTNFPDGSVCAFTPQDGTWIFGDPLVPLLDLYSVWAVRQLHLRYFGRWPGAQFVPERFERLVELHKDEACGCGKVSSLYGECCRPSDLTECRVGDGVRYQIQLGVRSPPVAVSQFIEEMGSPPGLDVLL